MQNMLTLPFDTPLQSAPFHQIKTADYLPAIKLLLEEAKKEIEEIAENPEPPDFENTIEALAFSGMQLEKVTSIFFNMNSAETNDELQAAAQEIAPLLSDFGASIVQNKPLFARIRQVYESQAGAAAGSEQKMLLDETWKNFVRSGALLNDEDKKKLEALNRELALKSLQFGQNVLAATNNYYKHILNTDELRGVPESALAQYAEEAKERGLEGYVITLHHPSLQPVLTYAENRELRRELALASGRRAFDGSDHDNQQLIREILELREKKAGLLGYASHADYVLEERMAKSSTKVLDFLNNLLEKATPYATGEIEALKALAAADGIEEMQGYDHAYYAEKLRNRKFDLEEEKLKPWFPLQQVQHAVFDLAGRLFGLAFEERFDIPKYHPDVQTYTVTENGEYKALLYTDYHPRKGKRPGAWMTSFTSQYTKDGENSRPHISIVCNFTKPTSHLPSLLTFREVTTLFHEFGHALHGILANTQYPGLSGTSVKWDFVELPSQFLENYCYDPEFLRSFARHYQTGEPLRKDKIEKLSATRNFMEGYQTLRQVGLGLLDMNYHTTWNGSESVKDFEDRVTAATRLYPSNPETAISPAFSHIFQGGYSAGYYSYKWAEVLDADAYDYFKAEGIFNPEIAAKYKKLLSSGGTKDPMELYREFRGREPEVEGLLKRAFG